MSCAKFESSLSPEAYHDQPCRLFQDYALWTGMKKYYRNTSILLAMFVHVPFGILYHSDVLVVQQGLTVVDLMHIPLASLFSDVGYNGLEERPRVASWFRGLSKKESSLAVRRGRKNTV